MARTHVRIQFGLWRKEDHRDVSKDARLLYVTILGDEALNQAGVVVLRPAAWAEDAAMTDAETDAALRELEARRFILTDTRTCELLVRTFIRNDGVADQPNVLRNALAAVKQIRSARLRVAAAAELRRLPPRRADRTMPNGKVFTYPDPHAVAEEIDPDGPRPPGESQNSSVNPSPKGSSYPDTASNPSPNSSANPSDRVSVQVDSTSGAEESTEAGTLQRTLPGTHGRTPSGSGRGSGSGTSLGTQVLEKENNLACKNASTDRAREEAPACDHAPAITREAPTSRPRGGREVAEVLNATAHSAEARTILRKWAKHHDGPLPPTIYTQLARNIDTLRERGATGAYVWAALLTWDEKRLDGDKPKPGLLPYLHDQIKLDGLAPHQLYATPVEYLRDEDIDVFEVLGYDNNPPEAPHDIENGPFDIRHDWYKNARAQRHHERCIQAREVIGRRQAMRHNAKSA